MESSRKRELEEREKEEAEKRQKMDPEGFREQMAERSKKAKLGRRIAAAAALCERFDKENVRMIHLESSQQQPCC